MLDLTVVRLKDKARFEGIWLRPRWQLPMSFADATRERFAREANDGKAVTRAELIARPGAAASATRTGGSASGASSSLAMRDYLRAAGVPDAVVLFTAEAGEPGTLFPTWEKRIVTDDVGGLEPDPGRAASTSATTKPIVPICGRARRAGRPLPEALQAAAAELGRLGSAARQSAGRSRALPRHAGRADDARFNRSYTVASPKTFDAFRGPSGLAAGAPLHAQREHDLRPAGQGEAGLLRRRRRTRRARPA